MSIAAGLPFDYVPAPGRPAAVWNTVPRPYFPLTVSIRVRLSPMRHRAQ
jgi:hypothetical protein